jgi:hypothetical protein
MPGLDSIDLLLFDTESACDTFSKSCFIQLGMAFLATLWRESKMSELFD